jgi:hypothetical protein
MAVSFREYPINFLLGGLFLLCILLFATGLGAYYGNNDVTGSYFNSTSLNATLSQQAQTTNNWKTSFTNDNPVIALGGFVLYGIWAIIVNIFTSVFTFVTLIFTQASLILQIPPIVLGVITACIIIAIIFAGWKVLRFPD